jgi:hypothetical protein
MIPSMARHQSRETGSLLRRFAVLPASYVLTSDHFARWQDTKAEWMRPRQCWLLLFVSHRWESQGDPDPDGRQHRALRELISDLCALWDATIAGEARDRVGRVPRLDVHGVAQAAVLFSRLRVPWHVRYRRRRVPARDFLPRHIGIWYDYACMPQRPRSPAEEGQFRAGLRALPDLLRSEAVNMVALREAADDYHLRAWCLTEALLVANKRGSQGVALRTDLLGAPLEMESPDERSDPELGARMRAALAGWADPAVSATMAANCLTMVTLAVGASTWEWFAANDGIAPTYLGDMGTMAAVWLADVLARLGAQQGQWVDLAAVLRDVAAKSGVRCAVDNDLVYTSLLMLHGKSARGTPIRGFYEDCIERHLSGQPLMVRATGKPGQFLSYEDTTLEFSQQSPTRGQEAR